jgi:hypothetical protein
VLLVLADIGSFKNLINARKSKEMPKSSHSREIASTYSKLAALDAFFQTE